MSTLTLRATKGSPLTNTEVDTNFSNLNTDKLESTYSGALNSLTGGTSIATVGTVTAGTWNAGVVAGQYGGTGVANTGKTITLGGNFTTSGAFTTTLTATANTSVTLPTTGTLVNTAVTTLSSLVSIGTVTTGTWNGTVIGAAYGGTGVANNAAATVTSSGNFAYTRTLTASTNVTFPTTGTLATLAGTESLTNKKLGSLTSNGLVTTSGSDGTLSVTTTLGVGTGGTGTTTAFTAGSVVFAGGSGVYSQDNANLFWDDTNNRLGLGTASPATQLHIASTTASARIDATSSASNNPELQLAAVGRQFNVGVGGGTFATTAIQGSYYIYDSTASTYRLVINSSGALAFGSGTAYGTSGQLLQSNGNAAPTWVTPSYATTGKAIAMAMVFGG
jgi:uncharacterized membrane protein YiaA